MKSRTGYYARPRHPLTGRQFTVRGRTPRELAAYLHRLDSLRQELRLGLASPADVDQALRRLRFGAMTFERAAVSYLARPDLAPTTRARVRSALAGPLRELAGEELDALDGPRLSAHFDRLAARLARGSLLTVWRTLRAVVRHAAERGWTARVPWGAWKPRVRAGREGRPQRDCARDEWELDAILTAARLLDSDGPYHAIEAKIAAAARLGLRQGELAGLRWYDVYPKRLAVGVHRQWDGAPLKSGVGAELAAPRELFDVLERHRARMGAAAADAGAPVFPSPSGAPYASGECLSTVDLRRAVALAGLDAGAWSSHSLRDTFATLEARKAHGDLRAVQQRTRHRSLSSLLRYLRPLERPRARPLLPASEVTT
jgi:integrase